MKRISNEKKLQIIFTSHRENIANREDINVRHIWQPANQSKSFCLSQTTPLCLFRLSGNIDKEYDVYVEDDLAEAIVSSSILREEKILNYVSIIKYGDICNAFSVAAGLHIQGLLSDKQLILTDGDNYVTNEDKLKMMKKRYSGNENGKDAARQEAADHVHEFNLPEGEHPEHYLWKLLKTKQGILADFANRINQNVDDKHHYIYDVYKLQGEQRPVFLKELIDTIKVDPAWDNYTSKVKSWAQMCRRELGV